MSNRETLDYDPIDALIEQGRRELAAGQVDKARWCFEEVLKRRPDEPRALLGLSYAARKSESPPGMGDDAAEAKENAASVLSADVEVVVLVREKRYGEALVKLRAELSKRPNDEALLRSIKHLEAHINRPSARPPARAPSASPADPDRLSSPRVPRLRVPTSKPPPSEEADVTEALPPSPLTPSPLATRESPAVEVEVDLSVTQPFDLVQVANTRQAAKSEAQALESVVVDPDAATPEAESESDERSEALVDSGETRLPDLSSSSGGFRLADDDPSGPALGSLPPSPMPTKDEGSSLWWILLLLAIAAATVVWALR